MTNKKRQLNYSKALVICHGKTEVIITRYIKTNLHIPAKIYAKDNGKHSIQITGLKYELETKCFKTIKAFSEHFSAEIIGKGKTSQLNDRFKVFIVMDTDDCTEQQKKDFISKKMFEGHWLYKYIEPVFNIPNIDNILYNARLVLRKVENGEKGTFYSDVFPMNRGNVTSGTVDEIQVFSDKLRKRKDTNLYILSDYFLECLHEVEIDDGGQTDDL